MIKVSVTDLEAFRLFRNEDWMTFDRLMEQLTRAEPESVMMAASTAFHELLRTLQPGEHTELHHGRFIFDLSAVDGDLALSPLRELRAQKVYDIGGVPVEIRGRVDGADGVLVEDHKIKYGAFDAEGYGDSVQWKLYLDMLSGKVFRYNVFEGPGSETVPMEKAQEQWELCPCPGFVDSVTVASAKDCTRVCKCGRIDVVHTDITIAIKALHSLTLYSYPELTADVIAHITDYITFAREHLTPDAIVAWSQRRTGSAVAV